MKTPSTFVGLSRDAEARRASSALPPRFGTEIRLGVGLVIAGLAALVIVVAQFRPTGATSVAIVQAPERAASVSEPPVIYPQSVEHGWGPVRLTDW
jgi:hypothetical protein